MKYSAKLEARFNGNVFCYMCYPKKDKNAVLYEVNMTGYEQAGSNFHLERQGYYTYLLSYAIKGGMQLNYRKEKYTVKAGDLMFINCDDYHEFTPSKEGWEFLYVHVSGLGIKYLFDEFINNTGYVYSGYPKTVFIREVGKIQQILEKLPAKKDGYTYRIEVNDEKTLCEIAKCVYTILTDVTKNLSYVKSDIPLSIKKALEYIRLKFCEKISVKEVADYVCLSKYYFLHYFEKSMKTTVYQYISGLRFERARWLLETTNMKLLDVALAVGYSDIQSINKLFKKNLGMTPTQYRKESSHYEVNNLFKE